MPRGVDYIYAMPAPIGGRCSGGNSDAAFAFLLHVIHGGCALVNLTYAMDLSGIIKHSFSRRGFARVDMCHDTYVPCLFKRRCSRHDCYLLP